MHQLGILLAAGYGRRFQALQHDSNKLLAPLGDHGSVAATSLHNLRQAVDHVIVVIRPNSPELYQQLSQPHCTIIESEQAHTGMGASLADAARALLERYNSSSVKSVLVTLADMPCIPLQCFHSVQNALNHATIAAPLYQGQRGHPVGFQWHVIPELTTLCGDEGARRLIQQHGIQHVPCTDAGVCFDIDEPNDLLHPTLHSFLRSRS
ncbi:MAG: nucleotidyltransferase family protein [Paenalcaligenes sp.]